MDIKVRKLRKTELPEINKLIARIFPATDAGITHGDIVLVAETKGKLIGFSHARITPTRVLLNGIGVENGYRGKGIGKMLLEKTLRAVKSGLPIYLEVNDSNDVAIGLYSKEGFVCRRYGRTMVMVRLPVN